MEGESRRGIFTKKGQAPKDRKRIKMGRDQFVICILAGILLMILAMPGKELSMADDKSAEADIGYQDEKETGKYGLLDSSSDTIKEDIGEMEKKDETEEYAGYMENKLEQAISVMEGAGKVKVMVTVSASKELVVEKDMPVIRSSTVENDSEGGSRNANEYENAEETVYSKKSDGSASPYVIKTLQPVVEGVVVVAQGGDRPEVRKNITEAVVALFDIEPHKIKIVKMKSE